MVLQRCSCLVAHMFNGQNTVFNTGYLEYLRGAKLTKHCCDGVEQTTGIESLHEGNTTEDPKDDDQLGHGAGANIPGASWLFLERQLHQEKNRYFFCGLSS